MKRLITWFIRTPEKPGVVDHIIKSVSETRRENARSVREEKEQIAQVQRRLKTIEIDLDNARRTG